MISHYPLATLLPWPAAPHHHPDPDCTLLLEGEGGVALQRYQARSPESSPRHWVSTPVIVSVLVDSSVLFSYCLMEALPVRLNNPTDVCLQSYFGVETLESLHELKGREGGVTKKEIKMGKLCSEQQIVVFVSPPRSVCQTFVACLSYQTADVMGRSVRARFSGIINLNLTYCFSCSNITGFQFLSSMLTHGDLM